MLAKLLRPVVTAVFTPLAKLLSRIGITADMVTILGTVATTVLALWLIPTGHLFLGALLIGIFALLDSVDGLLARMQGTTGPWGAFLDSTLDRISDGAIFTGITLWFAFRLVVLAPDYLVVQSDGPLGVGSSLFVNPGWYVVLNLWGLCAALACLVLGGVIPYARARAGSLGVDAHSGFFERATRLVFALVPLGFVQFGLPVIVLVIALSVLAVGSLITVFQRMAEVKTALAANDAVSENLTPAPERSDS
ncbi:MAG: CDP-alcohol phosphatidyltransferase family protein [Promicromonosporaceae bacterium]|nr:CDP-alcohol phosphatidyltransferase family protein [Promicromonosporaceae bacterium]